MRYLVLRESDGRVINAMEWDGDDKRWAPPAGHATMRSDQSVDNQIGEIGDTWDGETFAPPAPREPQTDPIDAKLAAIMRPFIERGVITKTDLPPEIAVEIDKAATVDPVEDQPIKLG